ncbi:hypothetical protein B484DRAFT_484594 [Ochromonadaceae sp. CCMP2298]|nr:hypothetical protein B484DRAFT_484594 [Ochromonadaceae sp. CCMP2298]
MSRGGVLQLPKLSPLVQALSLLLNLYFILRLIPAHPRHNLITERERVPSSLRKERISLTIKVPVPLSLSDGRASYTPLNAPKDLSPAQRLQTLLDIRTAGRRIFIDVGSNDGGSTAFFLDPENRLNISRSESIAAQGGRRQSFIRGLGSSGDWEIIAVEPNFYYTPVLQELRDKAQRAHLARSFTLYNGTAVTAKPGNVTFIYDNNVSHADAGATTMPDSFCAIGPRVVLPAVTLLQLFRRHSIRPADFVVLKVDVEGAEYDLLRSVVLDRLSSRIDLLAVEWHENNTWVFGRDNGVSQKYQRRHECLDWMLEDASMQQLSWI